MHGPLVNLEEFETNGSQIVKNIKWAKGNKTSGGLMPIKDAGNAGRSLSPKVGTTLQHSPTPYSFSSWFPLY